MHDAGDVGEGLDVVELATLDDGIDGSGALAAGLRSRGQSIVVSDSDAPDRAFGDKVVDFQTPVVEIAGECLPAFERVVKRDGERALC